MKAYYGLYLDENNQQWCFEFTQAGDYQNKYNRTTFQWFYYRVEKNNNIDKPNNDDEVLK